jgi:hypothetical protein
MSVGGPWEQGDPVNLVAGTKPGHADYLLDSAGDVPSERERWLAEEGKSPRGDGGFHRIDVGGPDPHEDLGR